MPCALVVEHHYAIQQACPTFYVVRATLAKLGLHTGK
jgi:hypothetical protein